MAEDLSVPLDLPIIGNVLEAPSGSLAAGSRRLESAAAAQVDGLRGTAPADRP